MRAKGIVTIVCHPLPPPPPHAAVEFAPITQEPHAPHAPIQII